MTTFTARYRALIAISVYTFVTVVAFVGALSLHRGAAELFAPGEGSLGLVIAMLVAIRMVSHRTHHLLASRWRFVGPRDLVRLVSSVTVGSVVFALSLALDPFGQFASVPVSVIILDWLLSGCLTAAVWITYRLGFELRSRGPADEPKGHAQRVVIFGAGEAGFALAREIQRGGTGMAVVGFADDDRLKVGTYVNGVRVEGTREELGQIVERVKASRVIIAMPSASPTILAEIVEACEGEEVEHLVLPGIRQVMQGKVSVGQLRPVRIEDLLGRPPQSLDLPQLRSAMGGACVMITGAAGSIGSELARQVAANGPGRLVLVDQAESDLFFVEMELREQHPDLRLEPVIADVCDRERMQAILEHFAVTHLYHAAAYKHVPLMEANPSEAVRNNVGGTATMLELAGSLGLTKFVLVSTDKAVRPSNIMGATKRVGELLLLEAATKYRDTTFTAVRFGNVLGSNGSVVPIFRRQMAEGRITVTHPDVTRYFMTIPEAVQLILLASLLPEASGRIAMLEMGEPVRIVELARRMIRLAGLREPDDVEIIFTGLRPGEKLHEQLTSDDETAAATTIERIRLVDSPSGAPMLSERVAKLVGTSLHLSGDPVIRQELFALLEPAAAAHPAD